MSVGLTAPPTGLGVSFARALATFGDRTAIITAVGALSYRELAARVTSVSRQLGSTRRLVLVTGGNDLGTLVAYLAALAAGHPVLLLPGDKPTAVESLTNEYDPDVVLRSTGADCLLDERRDGTAHRLHPELALLLSTSGSTGSPKLVRLSAANLQANAESIANYLDLRATDRAATTLPLHYCYGLSVINSHLLRGAGLILTDLSVADTCFWKLFRAAGGTSFAGVPYTFELLDRIGFAGLDLPSLRYVTQAGGRLAPEMVTRYATLGRRNGWDLFVMYGQTEATARMAYLPPELARSHPQAIGVPVPGGSFQLRPLPDWPEPDTGELIYTGPNVMLGYAESPADLRLGRTVRELATGDVARLHDDGVYQVIGRRGSFVKILGLRIEPQRIEAMLRSYGCTAAVFGDDRELVVAVTGADAPDRVRRLVVRTCGLPPRVVRVHQLPELPRLDSGKIDYPALRAGWADRLADPADSSQTADPSLAADPADPFRSDLGGELCRLYAELLDQPEVSEDQSFVSLGGDSLSYVAMSVRLEQLLGRVPVEWHLLSIRELSRPVSRPLSRWRRLETSIALRAAAIVLIVGSHIPVFMLKGGAHLLLAVAGFNFARFQLSEAGRGERVRKIRTGIGRIVVPTVSWTALVWLLTTDYGPANLVLLHSVFGPVESTSGWHFWFIEALVYLLIAAGLLISVPAVDRFERRHPFGLPMILVGLGLFTRYDLPGLGTLDRVPSAVVLCWLFALGWAAARAGGTGQRLVVTLAAAVTVPGFFGEPLREAVIVAGFALLIWVPTLPSLGLVNRVAGVLASSSLYIYLTHWQVFPRLDGLPGTVTLLVSLGFGIAVWFLATRAGRHFLAATRAGRHFLAATRAGRYLTEHRRRSALARKG